MKGAPAFSLIEVVVALAIFTGVVAVLSQAINASIVAMDSLKSDTRREQEFRFAMRQILQVGDRDELENGGELETLESGQLIWEADVEETNIVDLFSVRISIEWAQADVGSDPYRREQDVYLLRPGWAEADESSTLLEDKRRDLENARNGL